MRSTAITNWLGIGATVAVIAAVLMIGTHLGYSFAGGIEGDLVSGRYSDGFENQLDYVEAAWSSGEISRLFSNGLASVHLIRYVVALPFDAAQNAIGSWGPLLLIVALLCPLVVAFRADGHIGGATRLMFVVGRHVPFLLPLFLSGRTVLVSIGAAYIVLGVMQRTKFSILAIVAGVPLVMLSSSAVLLSLLFVGVMFARNLATDRSVARIAPMAAAWILLALAVAPSVLAKFDGFATGAAGYATVSEYVEQENGYNPDYAVPETDQSLAELIGIDATSGALAFANRVASRSTLYISFAYGQELRLAVYLGLLSAAWLYVIWSFFTRRGSQWTVAVGVFSLGLLLEGVGAWTVLWPIVWAYTGPDTPLGFVDRLTFRRDPKRASS